MANKKISELDSRASLSLSDLMAVGDPATGYLYKTTISDLKTLTGAGVISFNGRVGVIVPTEGDYNLTQLGDVIITSVTSGQFLRYNGSNFVNTGLSASDIPDLSATYQPLDGDLTTIAGLTGTGILKRTGSNTWSLLTDNTANWDTAYSDRYKWDGGSTGLVAATGRTSLGLVIGTDVQAWDADLDAIAALAGTSGFLKKTAANTWSLDTNTYLTTAAGAATYEPIITAGTTAQYWRGDKSWQTLNTAAVAELTNLYFTDARARAAISASTGISYNSTTGAISSTITQYTDALARAAVSLTTTGSSGAATYNSTTGVLNVPTYTLSGLGGQPLDADLTAIAGLLGTSGILKKTAADTWALDTNTYLTGNQTITLSGDVSGSGATAITTTIGAGKVTNAMLAGSIAASKLVGTDIATVGTITSGIWNGSAIGDSYISSAATWNAKEPAIAAGTTAQYWRGDKTWQTLPSYSLPIASATVLGGIKVGSNLSINATTGVLDATFTYTLPTASTTVLGGVKVDGTTITINGSGVISGANTYSLPVATASVLGGVKIGSGVSVDAAGVISVSTNYQAPINGTGFVKATGTTISYDNTSYLPLGGGLMSGNINYGVGNGVAWYLSPQQSGGGATNGAVLRLKSHSAAGALTDRSGALAWIDGNNSRSDVLEWSNALINSYVPFNGTTITTSANINSGDSITMGGELYYGGITSNRKARMYTSGAEGSATLNSSFWTGSAWAIVSTLTSGGTVNYTGNISAANLSGTNTGDQDLSGYATTAVLGNYVTLATTQTISGVKTFSAQGAAGYGTINLESDDPFIRLYDNGVGSTTDKKKWDIRVVSATGYESFDIRTVNDANTVFSTKLSIAHSGVATFSNSITINSGTLYLPGSIAGRTSLIECTNSGTANILGMPNLSSTFYFKYTTDGLAFTNDNSGTIFTINKESVTSNKPFNVQGNQYVYGDYVQLGNDGGALTFHKTIGLDGQDYRHRYILLCKVPTFGNATVNCGYRADVVFERVNGIGIDAHDSFDLTVSYGNNITWRQTSYQAYQSSLVQLTYGGVAYLALYIYSAPGYSVAHISGIRTNYGGWFDGNEFLFLHFSTPQHSSVSPNSIYETVFKQNLVSTGDITAFSDKNYKTNIVTIDNALNKVNALRGVSYNRIDTDLDKSKIGVIAQEIEEVIPEVVSTNKDGVKSVAYGNMVGLLIEAIKEQQKQIDDLKNRN